MKGRRDRVQRNREIIAHQGNDQPDRPSATDLDKWNLQLREALRGTKGPLNEEAIFACAHAFTFATKKLSVRRNDDLFRAHQAINQLRRLLPRISASVNYFGPIEANIPEPVIGPDGLDWDSGVNEYKAKIKHLEEALFDVRIPMKKSNSAWYNRAAGYLAVYYFITGSSAYWRGSPSVAFVQRMLQLIDEENKDGAAIEHALKVVSSRFENWTLFMTAIGQNYLKRYREANLEIRSR